MNYDVSQWSIVLLGSWNTALLNPDWVIQHIFDGEQAELDIHVVPGRRSVMRVRRDNIIFAPTEERVTIHCSEASEAVIQLAELKAVELLKKLPVTPVTAVGVNFGFEDADPAGSLLQPFTFRDAPKFAEHDLEVRSASITRKIIAEGQEINLMIERKDDLGISVRFNFHHAARSAEEAAELLEGNSVAYLAKSNQILDQIYGVEVE